MPCSMIENEMGKRRAKFDNFCPAMREIYYASMHGVYNIITFSRGLISCFSLQKVRILKITTTWPCFDLDIKQNSCTEVIVSAGHNYLGYTFVFI